MKKNENEFTAREKEVFKYLLLGYTNKQIAKILVITEDTVKAHFTSIFKKLGVTNRTAAVIKANKINRHQDSERP